MVLPSPHTVPPPPESARARASADRHGRAALLAEAVRDRQAQLDGALGRLSRRTGVLAEVAERLVAALRGGRKVLVAGNGGSAAEAQHFAAELVGRFRRERDPYAVVALTADTAILTAVANDYGYAEVFARQVGALGQPGDLLILFSTSGESENLLRAAAAGGRRGLATVAITGDRPNRLARLADCAVRVPATETAIVQELHQVVTHLLCDVVEAEMAGAAPAQAASAPRPPVATAPGRTAGRAILLDRDGTLVHARHFPARPEELVIYDGLCDELRPLQAAGFRLVVATNQSGLARGYFDEAALAAMHDHLRGLLAAEGVALAGIYHCPHHPDGSVPHLATACDCRKPAPGLLLRAAHDLDLDLARSWFVGDILDDCEAGNRAGCRTILVDLGTESPPQSALRQPAFVARSTAHALQLIRAVEGLCPGAECDYRPAGW